MTVLRLDIPANLYPEPYPEGPTPPGRRADSRPVWVRYVKGKRHVIRMEHVCTAGRDNGGEGIFRFLRVLRGIVTVDMSERCAVTGKDRDWTEGSERIHLGRGLVLITRIPWIWIEVEDNRGTWEWAHLLGWTPMYRGGKLWAWSPPPFPRRRRTVRDRIAHLCEMCSPTVRATRDRLILRFRSRRFVAKFRREWDRAVQALRNVVRRTGADVRITEYA